MLKELFTFIFKDVLGTPDNERAPLLQNYIQSLPSVYTESVGNFYSPMDSPAGSYRRFDVHNSRVVNFPLTKEQVFHKYILIRYSTQVS